MAAIARQLANNAADKIVLSSKSVVLTGVCALVAERFIQSTMQVNEKSNPKVYAAWGCKVIQIIATSHTLIVGKKLKTLVMALGLVSMIPIAHAGHRNLQKIIPSNAYRAILCVAGGYWIDRSVRLTRNTGPIMALTSLALLALSFLNARFDHAHLQQQMESRASLYQYDVEQNALLAMIFSAGMMTQFIAESTCK